MTELRFRSGTMRLPHPKLARVCAGAPPKPALPGWGFLSIAWGDRLSGKVVALSHHAAEALSRAERRLGAPGRHRNRLLDERCSDFAFSDSAFVVLVAVAVGHQQEGMTAE